MFGLLNVNKPAGVTSRDVVNRVQRLVRPHKVGHAGTLDPLATGVLIIAVGPATRLIECVQRMPKTYLGAFLLGKTSDTEDIEGTVVDLQNSPQPTRNEIAAVLPRFLGTIEQRPPAYSALKVAGERSYAMARRGAAVELAKRPVEIYSLDLVAYDYPQLVLTIRCGSGTYVRSLGRDIARSLRTDAVMSALTREAIGAFRLNDAIPADDLTGDAIVHWLLQPAMAVADLPKITISDDERRKVIQGQAIANRWHISAPEVAVFNDAGELLALATPEGPGALRATKNLSV